MAERKLTIRMNADTKNLQAGMATASASTQSFGKSIQSGITRHAAGIRMTGIAIAGVGVAMTAMVALSVKAAMSFEKELANVSTMLDDVSMKYMPEFAEGIREMSKEFGESTDTLNKGLYDILSASIAPSKALDVLAVSAKAATAGLTDTGVAADAITTIINSYGMAAEDAGKISDILFGIVKRGKTTFAELGPAIGKVAATASIAGVSFEELGAIIATVTRAGIRTDEAMTSVNGILRAFLKPTDDAAAAAREFGFELNTNTLRTIGLQGVMELLTEATAEQLAQMFPNIRGLKAIAAAMKDAAGFAEDYKFMLNAAGLTEEAFKKQTETAAFAFDQLKQQFTDILRVIGAQFIPIIKTEVLPLLLKFIDYAKVWVEKFKALSPEMKKFLMVLGPILIALGGLIALLPTLAPIIAILLGPIGLVIAAIAGLTAAFIYFYTTNEKFAAFINKMGGAIKTFVTDAWNRLVWLIKNWGEVWQTAYQIVVETFKFMGKILWRFFTDKEVFLAWVKLWVSLGKAVGKIVLNTMIFAGTIIARASSIIWAPIWESLKWLADQMKYYFQLGIERVKAIFGGGINWVISKVLVPLANTFISVVNKMAGGVGVFIDFFREGFQKLWGIASKVLGPIVSLIKWLGGKIKDTLGDLGEVAKEKFGEIKLLALDAFTIKIPESTLKEPKKFAARMSDAWETIKEQYRAIPDDLAIYIDQLREEWDNITAAASEYGEAIDFADYTAKVGALIAKLKELGIDTTALEKATEGVSTATEKYITTFDKLRKLRKTSAELADELKRAAEEALELGLRIGKYDYATLLVAANNAARDLADELKKANEKALKLGWTFGKYDYSTLLVASNQAARDLADELKKANEEALKLGWTFGKFDYATLLVASNQAARDLADELNRANEEALKLGWTFGKYDYSTLLVAANQAGRDLADELKRAEEEALKLGWTIGKFDYYTLLVAARKAQGDWNEEIKETTKLWERMAESIKQWAETIEEHFLDAFVNITEGIKEGENAVVAFGQALLDLVYSIPIIGQITQGFVNLMQAIGATSITAIIMKGVLEAYEEYTGIDKLREAFIELGITMHETIAGAEADLASLQARQAALAGDTREKLISELDKYYDYRKLKEMDLTELLALAEETKRKLAAGTLKIMAETAEEAAQREKDAKISALEAIIDAHEKEQKAINMKIALIKVEIKMLQARMYAEMAGAAAAKGNYEEAAKYAQLSQAATQEAIDALEDLEAEWEDVEDATEDAEDAVEDYGRKGKGAADDVKDAFGRTKKEIEDLGSSTNQARIGIEQWGEDGERNAQKITEGFKEARIGIELWGEEINKIPSEIRFDIIGDLHMPDIPKIGDQFFTIWGDYRAPRIPSYQGGIPYVPRIQVGVLHPKEAVLTASQAEEWRAGRGGAAGGTVTKIEQRIGEINITVEGSEVEDPVYWDGIVRNYINPALERNAGRRTA